jgi:hypothetical protein
VWTRTQGSYAALQVTRVLLLALLWIEEAKIQIPTLHRIRVFKEVIWATYPSLVCCWGTLDGVKIGIQKPSDDVRQSHFFNGWTYDHYIANLFIFIPDSQICAAYLNTPGTTHDSIMAAMSKI